MHTQAVGGHGQLDRGRQEVPEREGTGLMLLRSRWPGSAHLHKHPQPHIRARKEAPGMRCLHVHISLTLRSSEPLQGRRATGWGTPAPGLL